MKKAILIILILFSSCSDFEDETDFRNYLRDEHPYCEMEKLFDKDDYPWIYKVNDTLRGEIWLYQASANSRLKKAPLKCY